MGCVSDYTSPAGTGSGNGRNLEEDDQREDLEEALSLVVEYCPFGRVCDGIYDEFWEQLTNWIIPSYIDGSKNELYVMYAWVGGGSEGITIVTTPDGQFVVYHEYSEIGQTATTGYNLTINSAKGVVSGMVSPLDYTGEAISGSIGIGPLSGGAWKSPGGEVEGQDIIASFGPALPVAGTVSKTYAEPIVSGRYEGFMLFFCRAVLGGCGR